MDLNLKREIIFRLTEAIERDAEAMKVIKKLNDIKEPDLMFIREEDLRKEIEILKEVIKKEAKKIFKNSKGNGVLRFNLCLTNNNLRIRFEISHVLVRVSIN